MFRWFEGLLEPFPLDPIREPPKSLIRFCAFYTRGAWKFILFSSLTMTLIALIEVRVFSFVGELVNILASSDRTGFSQQEQLSLALMAFLVILGKPLLCWIRLLINQQVMANNHSMQVRWNLHRYLLKQSVSFYDDEFSGRVTAKILQTVKSIRECILKVFDTSIYVIIYIFSTLAVATLLDWKLCIPLSLWIFTYTLVLIFFIPKISKSSEQESAANSLMSGHLNDVYSNIQLVKTFSYDDKQAIYDKKIMEGYLSASSRNLRLSTLLSGTLDTLNGCLLFFTALAAILLWSQGMIEVGAVAAIVGLVIRISGMSLWVMSDISLLFMNAGMLRDGIASVSQPLLIKDQLPATTLHVRLGKIEVKGVQFSYRSSSRAIDIEDLVINAREKVAIVGHSGAGKSTLIKLLLRFYDPDSGIISIDGQNISGVTQESLRQNIGVVSQHPALLYRSVRDNILYGSPTATEDQLVQAARKANALDFIWGLTDRQGRVGMDAYVGESGLKLSGGQQQRLALARVILKNAPILVLDEATTALDAESESAIKSSIAAFMVDKTVIAITHRLSAAMEMERIIVMDRGKVVQQGTHSELLKDGGLYAKLWRLQAPELNS